jgi:hypothetical protein
VPPPHAPSRPTPALTPRPTTPCGTQPTTAAGLVQEYVLVPHAVRPCYLVHLLDVLGPSRAVGDADDHGSEGEGRAAGKPGKRGGVFRCAGVVVLCCVRE